MFNTTMFVNLKAKFRVKIKIAIKIALLQPFHNSFSPKKNMLGLYNCCVY